MTYTISPQGREDWCPQTGNIHRFTDYGSWVEHQHPICDYCGYVDITRTIVPTGPTSKKENLAYDE